MPPRRKKGLGRIDAAVCALGQMGYSRQIVVKTIKQLLKVYGTDEAWGVIEEGCYTMVIEKIIEDEENQKLIEDTPIRVLEGPSDRDVAADCHRATIDKEMLNQALAIEDTQSGDKERPSSMVAAADCYIGDEEILTANQVPAIEVPVVAPTIAPPPRPRRLPCYGWISETESDSDSDSKEEKSIAASIERKRKQRWDVRSYDDSKDGKPPPIPTSVERKQKQRWDVKSYE